MEKNMNKREELLSVKNMKVQFKDNKDIVTAVNNVSFDINRQEIVAVVGESGSGKSVTMNAILKLLPPNSIIKEGEVIFNNQNLHQYSNKKMRDIRGNEISMIFQEPMTSLNPLFTIGDQLNEIILLHQKTNKKRAKEIAIEMLKKVEIPRPENVYKSYPHTLSGGMRQRVMIAMALSCNPKLLIADEPTTALDVTIQAQVLDIIRNINEQQGSSIILITHDLGVVAEIADRVLVMYAGEVVEEADVFQLFKDPKHPYTKKLLDSTPKINETQEKLTSIKGTVPHPTNMPTGCHFHPRCPVAMDICKSIHPSVTNLDENRKISCLRYEDVKEKEVSNYG